MSYTALYRKFRPSTFEDVKGQDHIVTTLKNQIRADRIGHAYLFCGTRGTGKTTIAQILARSVNCEHPVDGSPCNECPTCLRHTICLVYHRIKMKTICLGQLRTSRGRKPVQRMSDV